jgi:K+-transporting ATPase A subunit
MDDTKIFKLFRAFMALLSILSACLVVWGTWKGNASQQIFSLFAFLFSVCMVVFASQHIEYLGAPQVKNRGE